jgi:hypothetical protein
MSQPQCHNDHYHNRCCDCQVPLPPPPRRPRFAALPPPRIHLHSHRHAFTSIHIAITPTSQGTDGAGASGGPVTDLGHKDNTTRSECCQLCTTRPDCEMFAFGDLNAKSAPGERARCWMLSNVIGTKPSSNREAGCPSRQQHSPSAMPLGSLDFSARTESANTDTSSWWSVGISGEVVSLPKGFTHSTILSASVGVTTGLHQWGRKMQSVYNTTRADDVGLSHLSYWTDNGALLPPPPAAHTYTHTHTHTHTQANSPHILILA